MEDKIIQKLIEHDNRFDKLEQRVDETVTAEQFTKGYDDMITILRRLDEERIFTMEWVKRIEADVEEQKRKNKDNEDLLKKIKFELKIA